MTESPSGDVFWGEETGFLLALEGVFVRGGCFCWLFFRLLDGITLQGQYRPPGTVSPSGNRITLQGQYRPQMTELPSGEGDGVFDPRIGEDANENN